MNNISHQPEPAEDGKHKYSEVPNGDCCQCGELENHPSHILSQPPEGEWRAEFREYFDRCLKPKEPTMRNLDRELCIDFIEKRISTAIATERGRAFEKVASSKKTVTDLFPEDHGNSLDEDHAWNIHYKDGYNKAIDDLTDFFLTPTNTDTTV